MRSKVQNEINESNKVLGKFSDKQNEYFESDTLKNNGTKAATEINHHQGKKNAESGHMKNIQKIGAPIGGKIGGVITRNSGKLKENGKLGNEANQQLYGTRIIAYNEKTEECWEYISMHEAARDTDVPTCTIRKILRGDQPKTRTGWYFQKK